MGKCLYCGKKAGFLRGKHKECEEKYLANKSSIFDLIESAIANKSKLEKLKSSVEKLANEGFISTDELNELYTSAYDTAVEKFLEDGMLTKDEEEKLSEFKKKLNLDQGILDKNGSYIKVGKAVIIRDLSEGKTPHVKLDIVGNLPFVFQKDEKLIWVFQNVEFYEEHTRTEYQGGSIGGSVRIARGFYLRTSAFRGNPVQTEEMKFIDTGMLAITDKYLYFASSVKNFRIEFNKIITMTKYEDGIGLQKDGVSAKPRIFKNLDGWFAYNAISNLNKK